MPSAREPADGPHHRGVSRRGVLRVGGGGALALVLGGIAGWVDRRDTDNPATAQGTAADPAATPTTPTPTPTPTAAPIVIPEVGEVDPAIILLGQRVIDTTGEDDLGALLALLPAGDGDPLVRAATAVRDDFLASRTIVVDGWVLAASEARAAAVVALLCGAAAC